MANLTVKLYIRIKTEDGKKPFCEPVYLSKGRLKGLYAFVDGKPEHRPEGIYYLRFGTGDITVQNTPGDLQNRSSAGLPVEGAFDSPTLPPSFQ